MSSYNALPVRRGSSGSAGGRLGWLAAVTKEARGASEVGDDGQEALIRRMAHEIAFGAELIRVVSYSSSVSALPSAWSRNISRSSALA